MICEFLTRMILHAGLLIFTLLSAVSTSVVIAQDTSDAGMDGRGLYIKYGCYQCHGYEGQGGLASGPRIAPNPLPFPGFKEIVRRPYGIMPAYSERVIGDQTIELIHAYLQGIKQPEDLPRE